MKEIDIWRSCGMPLTTEEEKGTTKDGGKSNEYCTYCFQKGTFTSDVKMDEMIENYLEYIEDVDMTKEELEKAAKELFPTLKRWKKV